MDCKITEKEEKVANKEEANEEDKATIKRKHSCGFPVSVDDHNHNHHDTDRDNDSDDGDDDHSTRGSSCGGWRRNKKKRTDHQQPRDHDDGVAVAENDGDVFAMLPTELLSYVLLAHLDSVWHFICMHVCHRWRNLLLAMQRPSSLPGGSGYTAALAGGGHLEVLQWARSQGCPWDKWTFMLAAQEGHLKVLQWVESQEEQL